ncbi:uncharacterized protein [Rutidosis leptorrhynchoides]|uniref:uncharacterized protein n=1 Tax=Rutidosis leptorrhynchoides TaxID=125765 RepID=UPI003A99DF5A
MARRGVNFTKLKKFKCKSCGCRNKPGKSRIKSKGLSSNCNSEDNLKNSDGFAVDGKFRWVKRICSSERPSFAKDAVGNSGGLLLIWDSNYFEAIAKADGDFFLAVKGRWKSTGSEFVVVNVYGPHNDVSKILFWDSLEKLMGLNEEAWVLCRDFNEVREHDDRLNCIFHQHQAKRFNEFILRNRLVEIPINGKKFTRISDDGTKFSKLDRFLVLDHFIRLWDDLSITTMDRFLSDHVPIILQEKVIDFSLKPFKVFDEWLNKEGIEDVINEAWGKLVKGSRFDCNFRDKMKNVKFALKFWSSCTFGGLDNEIITLKKEAHEWEIKAENNGMNDVEREKWLDCRRELEGLFSETEVWNAIKDCGNHKAPSPDGFNITFYKKIWSVIKGDLMNALNDFWLKGELSHGCNASFITLIPMKVDPLSLNEYRPISLIGSFYKVLSKVLADRLKRVVPDIVGYEQSAFIRGRNIIDGALIANECVDFLKYKRLKSLIFKVDFEKAFDSLCWDFLLEMMGIMGFGGKWKKWVISCLKSASISILVNGSPTNEFTLQRGVRQRDPLSPFLFILAAEGLNLLAKAAVRNNMFEGVEIGVEKIPISHLQYADDTIFFGSWSGCNIDNLMKLLKCIELASGLQINYNKSNIFGIIVDSKEVEAMANIFWV